MKKKYVVLLLTLVLCLGLLTVTAGAARAERTVYSDSNLTTPLQKNGDFWVVPCASKADVENVVYYYHLATGVHWSGYGKTEAGCDIPNSNDVELLRINFGENISSVSQREVQVYCGSEFVSLKFLLLPGGYTVPESEIEIGDRLLEKSDYKDYKLKEVDEELDYSPYGPAEFQYGGNTYYLGMMLAIEEWPYRYGSEPVIATGKITPRSMKTGIWTYDKKAGYQLVENPETIFPQTFLDSISMEIFAENNEGQYPMLIERQDTLPGYEVCFTDDCHNAWYTVVTAKLDGETTITAVTRFEWIINYVLDAVGNIQDVQDINNQLNARAKMIKEKPDLSYRTTFRIQLPAAVTNTQGQDIVIPAGLRSVRIEGSRDFQEQVWYTTIYNCGIQANCDEVFLSKLHLYGVTQDVEQSANPTITKGKIGFYGSAQSQYSDCWFSRFDIGVEFGNDCSDGLRFGGQHVIIENCNIGYYMDNTTTTNGGNIQMDDFVFRGNDIAVFLKNVSKNNTLKPYDYKIINSFFNDNRVDVKNQTGRWFFFPKNVINHTNGPVVTRSVVSASRVPVLEDGNTSMYPVAYEVGMMQFEYLYEESGVVSNDLSYQIPVSEISGQEYAVIEKDTPIVAYTFDTTQMAPTLMKLAAGGVQETPATFDPTVELTSAADKITLVMDAMPDGKSARVFVPCQWSAVQVLEGETQIEAEADGVTVSFLATKGGTYEIIAQTSAGGDTGGIVIPSGPVADDKQDEAPKADFSDVAEDTWYADAVQYVYEKGLMNGMGGGKFQPEAETSRAMVITMLARLAGADVDDSDPWYAKALAWAVDNGVSDGTTPNGAITRQQIVTMLWRSAGSPKPVGKLKEFADADKIASYALDAMTWAVEQKIIQGVGGNRLDPTATATRAQIATMFRNYLER